MDRNGIQEKLSTLKNKKKEFDNLLTNFNFETEQESLEYIEKNKSEFEKLEILIREIKELEWHLLSEDERKKIIEDEELLKMKYRK